MIELLGRREDYLMGNTMIMLTNRMLGKKTNQNGYCVEIKKKNVKSFGVLK
jgi:hypothetical protein